MGREPMVFTAMERWISNITDNVIDQFSKGGIYINSGSAEVRGNRVIGPYDGVTLITNAVNGIVFKTGATGIIDDNEVSNCGWIGATWAGIGIGVWIHTMVVISGNYVHDCQEAIDVGDLPDCYYGSEWIANAHDITVESNIIDMCYYGIGIINDVSTVLVQYNEITDFLYQGIYVDDYSLSNPCCNIQPTNVVINCNTIIGYNCGGIGLYVGPTVLQTVDAECNMWGACNGPYNATLNPLGQGSSVIGNADFTPWIGSPPNINGPYTASCKGYVQFNLLTVCPCPKL